MTTEINFSDLCGFSDKQWIATHTADAHKYTLFGGSRGPGKSYWLRWWLVRLLLRHAGAGRVGVRTMLGCEDYPSLYERQVSKVLLEFPPWLGEYQASRNEYRLRPCYGSGVIAFRNLDDPSKYQSSEFAAMAIDEITKNKESTFDILRGSLRWRGVDDVKMVAASNPEANWVRDYWIERTLPEAMQGHEDEFAFVAALPEDNPHLPQSYWEMLDTLSGARRMAWRYGDWYAAVEGLVYGNFNSDNIVDTEPDKSRAYSLAIDDGYIDPRATLFIQRQAAGDLLVFDELYETQKLEEETISNIEDICAQHNMKLPSTAAVSHEAVALRKRLGKAKIPSTNWMVHRVAGAASTRLAAITLTRSMFCDGKGHRAIKIHRRCKHLIDEISAGYKYPEGKHGLETHPADGNDHAINALEGYVWATYGTSERQKSRSREY